MSRIWIVTTFLAILSGCAAPTIYQWGDYEKDLYGAYKDPTRMNTLRINLESQMALMEGSRQKVAPGLYAELGTLYLQLGSSEKAIEMYKKERDAWPESKGLMTSMIQNLERRQKEKQVSEK
jgi:hypothetical protein